MQKTRAKNSHAWAPLRSIAELRAFYSTHMKIIVFRPLKPLGDLNPTNGGSKLKPDILVRSLKTWKGTQNIARNLITLHKKSKTFTVFNDTTVCFCIVPLTEFQSFYADTNLSRSLITFHEKTPLMETQQPLVVPFNFSDRFKTRPSKPFTESQNLPCKRNVEHNSVLCLYLSVSMF